MNTRRSFLRKLASSAVMAAASIYAPSTVKAITLPARDLDPVRTLECGCEGSCRWEGIFAEDDSPEHRHMVHTMLDNQLAWMRRRAEADTSNERVLVGAFETTTNRIFRQLDEMHKAGNLLIEVRLADA